MVTPAPDSTSFGTFREIRLGLVCYGGVSLAIYMHGMTKELQKLVIASRALEEGTVPKEGTSEHVYWQVLREIQDRSPDGVRPSVVIDVVAGTSAGGINGVILCKALAHNLSQDALTQLWFEKADKKQLLGGSLLKEGWRLFKFIEELPGGNPEPPLDGKAMLGWLLDALTKMDQGPAGYQPQSGKPPSSLMPEGHPLQLFVTTTDYYGYRQSMTIEDPPTVTERRNRNVLNFNYLREGEKETTQFDQHYNGPLAFIARATSSFPGAFPPVQLADAKDLPPDMAEKFFRAYQLAGADATKTYFIDGGVLNNYPFQPAIDAIVQLPAESEVSRYLLYLQPDPGSEVKNPGEVEEGGEQADSEPPHFFGTVWAGLSSVASSQPILEALIAARSFNERVRRTDELVAGMQKPIQDILEHWLQQELQQGLGDELAASDPEKLATLRSQLDEEAKQKAGYLYEPYIQIRAHSIVEQFAHGICQLCNYKEEQSNNAFLIRMIIDAWARKKGVIGENLIDAERSRLIDGFDLGYTQRRFGFVLQRINQFYNKNEKSQITPPPRHKLDAAKKTLYARIATLKGMIDVTNDAMGKTLVPDLNERFPPELSKAVLDGKDLREFVRLFVEEHYVQMNGIADRIAIFFREQKNQVHGQLYRDFLEITADWTAEQRSEVMLRYLGFPFWDAMIYPITRLSEAGELRPLNIVRMSPADSTRLGQNTAKGKLQGVHLGHFGAFLKREWRENDYLWGRLDAAERLIGLLLKDAKAAGVDLAESPGWVKLALTAIVAEEKDTLGSIPEKIQEGLAKLWKGRTDSPSLGEVLSRV